MKKNECLKCSSHIPSCPVRVNFPSPPIRVASTNMISPPIAVQAKPEEKHSVTYMGHRHTVSIWRKGRGSRNVAVARALASHHCCSGTFSRTRRHMWVEFVVGSSPYSEGFSPAILVFSSKTNISKFQFDPESEGHRFVTHVKES